MQFIKQLILALIGLSFSYSAMANFTELTSFGENPGSLSASIYSPNASSSSLVVLLHGCVQSGEKLAQQSGLLGLAKKHSFALLIPQQSKENNIKDCFNWYAAADFSRDKGESLSIKNMIETTKLTLASENVYIIGLSAGGAMTSIMLSNYPELFTAGAIIAGIPFPCADGLITGISCMKNGPSQTASELSKKVSAINSPHTQWPRLSIWTGQNDQIVNPLNAQLLAKQWAKLSQLSDKPFIEHKKGYTVTQWQDKDRLTRVELIEIAGIGHGIMVNPDTEHGGQTSDYLLASPLSTAKHVINFWQLD
jgi:poly(hydroxyalkanoate) depolymerase family esterase